MKLIGCFLKMAFELYGMLAGNISPMTGENVKPAYGGENEAFLRKVVTPIYEVIAKVFVPLIYVYFSPCSYRHISEGFSNLIILLFFNMLGSCKEQTREIKTFSMEEL